MDVVTVVKYGPWNDDKFEACDRALEKLGDQTPVSRFPVWCGDPCTIVTFPTANLYDDFFLGNNNYQ